MIPIVSKSKDFFGFKLYENNINIAEDNFSIKEIESTNEGKIYKIDIKGIIGNGKLSMQIKEGAIIDKGGLKSESQNIQTGITIDNTAPVGKFKEVKIQDGKVNGEIILSENIRKIDGWSFKDNNLKITKEFTNNISYQLPITDYAGNTSNVDINITQATYINVVYASHNSCIGWSFGYGNYDVAGKDAIKVNPVYRTEALAFNISGNVDKDFVQANTYIYTYWGEGSKGKCTTSGLIYNYGYNPGKNAFKLYDTYGFPLDLTIEILEEKGFTVDKEGFDKEMQIQRETARAARKTTNYMGADATVYEQLDPAMTTKFVGYDELTCEGEITAMTTETEVVSTLNKGDKGTIVADQTAFYATSGGQEADKGVIVSGDAAFEVEDVIKLSGGKFGHVGHVVEGTFNVGDKAVFTVNEKNRALGAKNHSATHLLQKALREVLGTHVEQAGSLNNAEHLRFDFTHFSPLSDDEIARVEKIVNEKIAEDLPVVTKVMSMEDAKKTGAMALFGEKYGDEVRVVSMGDFSVELCGGTHVKNTGVITAFKILSETGVASGVRRIEAVTDQGVFNYYHKQEEELKEAAKALKATPATLLTRIESLLAEVKELKSENESLKSKLAKDALGDVMDQVEEVKGVKVLATSLEDVDMNGLRELGDNLKEKLGEGVIVLASQKDGKVFLVAMVTDEAQKAGAHAGNLIKAIAGCVGGGGGGRPNMAQAGGKNPAGIPEAVAKVKEILESQIS